MKYLLIIACLLSLSLTGCRDYGTEGGNPGITHNGALGGTVSDELVGRLCNKRKQCLGETFDNCIQATYAQAEITNELRINPPYRNILELATAETKGEVSSNSSSADTCKLSINNLDCADPLAQEAFESLEFDKIHLLLRSSLRCSEIFSTKM